MKTVICRTLHATRRRALQNSTCPRVDMFNVLGSIGKCLFLPIRNPLMMYVHHILFEIRCQREQGKTYITCLQYVWIIGKGNRVPNNDPKTVATDFLGCNRLIVYAVRQILCWRIRQVVHVHPTGSDNQSSTLILR